MALEGREKSPEKAVRKGEMGGERLSWSERKSVREEDTGDLMETASLIIHRYSKQLATFEKLKTAFDAWLELFFSLASNTF